VAATEFLAVPSIQRYYFTQYTAATRAVSDGVTASTTTVTSATAAFSSSDVGATIVGAGIPALATIATVTNATTVVISAAATATATGVALTITRTTAAALAAFQTALNANLTVLGGSFQVLTFSASPTQAVLVISPSMVLTANPTDWVGLNYGNWQVVPNASMSGLAFVPSSV
jgi:hypothetical protein